MFLEKINKIDKPLTRLIKKKRERAQINKIINKRRETTDAKEIQRIVRKYYEQLYVHKMDKFPETYSLTKLNQEESENLNRHVTCCKIETVIKKLSINKRPGSDASQLNFTKHSKKKQHLSFSNYFTKFKRMEGSQTHFMKPALS